MSAAANGPPHYSAEAALRIRLANCEQARDAWEAQCLTLRAEVVELRRRVAGVIEGARRGG